MSIGLTLRYCNFLQLVQDIKGISSWNRVNFSLYILRYKVTNETLTFRANEWEEIKNFVIKTNSGNGKTMPLKLLFVSLRQWHRLWMDPQPNDLYFFQFFQKSCLSFVFFRMSRSKDTNWDPTKNKDGGQVIKKSFLYATIFWKLRVISR